MSLNVSIKPFFGIYKFKIGIGFSQYMVKKFSLLQRGSNSVAFSIFSNLYLGGNTKFFTYISD